MQEDGYNDGKIQAVPRAVQLKKHVKFMQRTIDVLPSAYGFFDSSRYQFGLDSFRGHRLSIFIFFNGSWPLWGRGSYPRPLRKCKIVRKSPQKIFEKRR